MKLDSFELHILSNSDIFSILGTKSTCSYISETSEYTSNLWQCISIITVIINKTGTYCSFPICILLDFDADIGNECEDFQLK